MMVSRFRRRMPMMQPHAPASASGYISKVLMQATGSLISLLSYARTVLARRTSEGANDTQWHYY
eukprot:2605460-Rhodomonas_salina.1